MAIFLHVFMNTRELFDFSSFIFKMFTISIPQSIGEGLKKRVPVNVVGKKFKVIKNVHNVDGS